MKLLKISNPFNAPVYYEETVKSTMDVSRLLAGKNEKHGTVITADFQEEGRGRVRGRKWRMDRGKNLSFTILLRYQKAENIPAALTLRAGFAVLSAIEEFASPLKGKVFIKWPNDIIINGKKASGILCEAEGGNVHLGIGVNVMQNVFPDDLCGKATSLFLETKSDKWRIDNEEWRVGNEELGVRDYLLEGVLYQLFLELENSAGFEWKEKLENHLYKKNESVVFIDGGADSGKEIKGKLIGISDDGGLLIISDGENQFKKYFTGELKIY